LDDRCKGGIEFPLVCGVHHQNFSPDGTTRFLQVSGLDLGFRKILVAQHGDDGSLGYQLVQ